MSCLTMEFKLGQERREINNKVKDNLGVRKERLIKELNIHLHSRKQISKTVNKSLSDSADILFRDMNITHLFRYRFKNLKSSPEFPTKKF